MNEAGRDPQFIKEVQALLAGRQVGRAIELLKQRLAGNRDPEVPLHLALAQRMSGDVRGALASIDQALALEPYNLLVLLSKGALLEMDGQAKESVRTYRNALKLAPADEQLISSLKAPVAKARQAVRAYNEAMAAHIRKSILPLKEKFGGENLDRFDESIDIFSGLKKRHVHEPLLLDFPELPAIAYWDRSYFPWLRDLEAATDIFRDDALRLLKEDWEKFHPYIQLPAHAPTNQWAPLNHSPSWSTLHIWRDGKKDEAVAVRCSNSVKALERFPLADQAGLAPTAMFSALAPRTNIPAHTGSTNVRLIVHLPLILPSGCRFRVGNVTREWKMGEAWVFDDSIDHEAWNDSDELRVILIFDVWNPLLSKAERELVTAMINASNAFHAV